MVIAIIALLASIVLVALNGARVKARDAKRIADLRQIQTALELYYSDNGTFPQHICESTTGGAWSACWSTLISSSYIATMPIDPLNVAGQYGYYYSNVDKPNGNCGYVAPSSSGSDYIMGTHLESTSSSPNECGTPFSGWDNSNINYIVGY